MTTKMKDLLNPFSKAILDEIAVHEPESMIRALETVSASGRVEDIYYIGKNYLALIPEEHQNLLACTVMAVDMFEDNIIGVDEFENLMMTAGKAHIKQHRGDAAVAEFEEMMGEAPAQLNMRALDPGWVPGNDTFH